MVQNMQFQILLKGESAALFFVSGSLKIHLENEYAPWALE